jgi:Cu(I)/Ag(I) efflux system membrane protein CusA/SilA
MIVYLDQAWQERQKLGTLKKESDFFEATLDGGSKSLRPVLMAVSMNIFGLIPVMMATGLGADVIKRISSPMFGGLFSLTILTLVIVPIIYKMREGRVIIRGGSTNG